MLKRIESMIEDLDSALTEEMTWTEIDAYNRAILALEELKEAIK